MITQEQQYQFITSRISALADATYDGFKLFVTMFSAILGGTFWLRLQLKGSPPSSYVWLSDALIFLVAVVCIAIVWDNFCAWRGYRMKLLEYVDAPAPRTFWRSRIEFFLCLMMAVAAVLFAVFNPFRI